MGKGCFPLTGDKVRFLRRAASIGILVGMIAIAGCATYPGLDGMTARNTAYYAASEPAAAPADPARASAVADIRARADAAKSGNVRGSPNVFYIYGPSGASMMTRAERLAVEAELEALLAEQQHASDPAETERLKARAAYLKRLAEQHVAQAEADILAASQAANSQ